MKNKLYFVILIFFFLSTNFSKANELKRAYSASENGDYKTAIYFLSYYANMGNSKAQYNYGIMLKKGLGTKKDDNEAFNWIFLSAKQNNMLANYALGNLYYKGEGTKINYKLSFDSYLKSALQGHPSAKINLGHLYFEGKGVKKSFSKAYLWWQISLDQNINGAKQNLAMLKNIMSKKEIDNAKKLYYRCLKVTLLECSQL